MPSESGGDQRPAAATATVPASGAGRPLLSHWLQRRSHSQSRLLSQTSTLSFDTLTSLTCSPHLQRTLHPRLPQYASSTSAQQAAQEDVKMETHEEMNARLLEDPKEIRHLNASLSKHERELRAVESVLDSLR